MLEKIMYWFWLPIVQMYIWVELKLNVQRHSVLPDGPKIFVANHPTSIDPYFVAYLIRQPAKILITYLAFELPVLGTLLRWGGHIVVAPEQGRAAFDAAAAALARGENILIFPEGNLSPVDGPGKARNGAARLALISGAAVVPIGIYLPEAGIQRTHGDIGGEYTESRWPRRTAYAVTLGQALHFAGDAEDRAQVAATTERMMAAVAQLRHEGVQRLQLSAASPRAPRAAVVPNGSWRYRFDLVNGLNRLS